MLVKKIISRNSNVDVDDYVRVRRKGQTLDRPLACKVIRGALEGCLASEVTHYSTRRVNG